MNTEEVIDILQGIKDGTACLMKNMPQRGETAIDTAIDIISKHRIGNFELFCTITGAQLFSVDLFGFRRHELCPLMEVSVPHGDLVDRDTLMQEVEKYIIKPDTVTKNTWNECVKTIMYEIKNAHAIIEEEDV